MATQLRPVSGIYDQYLFSGQNAINSVKYNNETETLAVARKNSLEIWNCSHYLHKVCDITGIPRESLEDIVWCGNTLYSAGLNGYLYQYSIDNLEIEDKFPITGGPAHCLACSDNEEFIAAGTETGNICIFEVTHGYVTFKTFFKQNTRILCLAWHPNNNRLVAGSMNEVFILDVKTGKTKIIKIQSDNPRKDVAIHAVEILEDMTIVTGDSRGFVCFFDGKLGTYIRQDEVNKAPILCLQKAENDKVIYATGVDSSITKFMYNIDRGAIEWVKNVLGSCGKCTLSTITYEKKSNTFLTGGDDSYLYRISSTALGNLWVESYPMTPRIGYASVACDAQRLFLGTYKKIQLHQMSPMSEENPTINRGSLMANFLMEDNRFLRSTSISPDGSYVAYMDTVALRIYKCRFAAEDVLEKNLLVALVKLNPNIGDYRQIQFLDNKRLLATKNNVIQVIKIARKSGETSATVKKTIEIAEGAVRLIVPSTDGQLFAVTNSHSDVYLYKSKDYTSHKLPNIGALPTAVAFDSDNSLICVAYATGMIKEFTTADLKYTPFYSQFIGSSGESILIGQEMSIRSVSYNGSDTILLTNTSEVIKISKNLRSDDCDQPQLTRWNGSEKLSKRIKLDNSSDRSFGKVSLSGRDGHIHFYSQFTNTDGILLEVTRDAIEKSQPKGLKRKIFGHGTV